jgi:hypothetical protein
MRAAVACHTPSTKRTTTMRVCTRASCENDGANRCARCKVSYCSAECQKADWKTHKINCTKPSGKATKGTKKAAHEVRMEVAKLSREQMENVWSEMFKRSPGDISKMDDEALRATINLILLEMCSKDIVSQL